MPYRLTKIYTRKGDDGYTHLRDERIPKDDLLVEAIGTLDELNSHIGVVLAVHAKSSNNDASIKTCLIQVQNHLFDMGGELHLPEHVAIKKEFVSELEKDLDQWNSQLPPLKEFLLPGGNLASSTCHVARTVCRRAERQLVKLHRQTPLSNPEMLRYLNRLSDLLFVLARILGKETNSPETTWDHQKI